MDRKLIEAWEAIEKSEKLTEAKGKKAQVKVKAPIKAPKKKLDEEGVGGAYGAGVGPASHAPTAGNTITKSGAAAVAPAKLGTKPKKIEEVSPAIQSDAQRVAQQAISKVKAGTGDDADGAVVAGLTEEDPLPPGAEEIDPHADGPEAAADAHLEDPAAEEANEDVTVDAETAEQVINAIQTQYPGAIITISVQVPEDTPFDTDLVAAAQEVTGEPEAEEIAGDAEVGGDEAEAEVGADSEIGGEEELEPEQLQEKRKIVISKTRKQIKEMFARMKEDDEEVAPEAKDGEEVAPEAEVAPEVAEETPVVEPEIEVGDTKIALTPEQWGQVIGTTDLLGAGAVGDEAGADLSGELAPPEDAGEVAPEEIDELTMKTDDKGKLRAAVIGKEDKAKDKKMAVGIKQPVNESFNRELNEYASTLKKMMSE